MSEDTCCPNSAAPQERAPRFKAKHKAPQPPEWSGRAEYDALSTRIMGAVRPDLHEAEFDAVALEIHDFQRRHNAPYAHWCATLPKAASWREIPAIPQAMFKQFRLACFPAGLGGRTFRTSGTTGETRGEHHLLDTALYEAAALAGWDHCGFEPLYQLVLSPQAADAPDSSLACMWSFVKKRAPFQATFVRHDGSFGTFQLSHVLDRFTRTGIPSPAALLGPALAFLNFFEREPGCRTKLETGSYVVETGGFKGARRDTTKAELYRLIEERLGVPPEQIWNEYGMCELSSQFYARGLDGVHTGGPWVRALVVSPQTGREVAVGETGVLRIFDLANLGSVLAIQTADLAIRRVEGFTLLGRDPAAIPRGCSRAADETMRRAEPAPESVTQHGTPKPPHELPPLHTAAGRAASLANAARRFPFLAEVTAEKLTGLIAAELGDERALDQFVPHAGHFARAIAPGVILHILSGNTPAAALQSLSRGLLLGSLNLCKLPSAGLPEVAEFIAALPAELAARIESAAELPELWLSRADAVIVFGSDETISHFRTCFPPDSLFVGYGHKISVGVFFETPDDATLTDAARDVATFDQLGCLSPVVFFTHANVNADGVAAGLARAMRSLPPRQRPLTVSEANSIRTLREELAFRAANGEPIAIHASEGTDWTVIADTQHGIPQSPLHRTIFIRPLPSVLERLPHLSTCGIFPATPANAETAAVLGATRICPIGRMQLPPVAWHHDGLPVLARLVRWVDFEPV